MTGSSSEAPASSTPARVPAWGLIIQGIWAALLVLPRTYDPVTRAYGNLYSSLLDYVISAALIFYILTIAAIFRLRQTQPHAAAPLQGLRLPASFRPSTSPLRRRSC